MPAVQISQCSFLNHQTLRTQFPAVGATLAIDYSNAVTGEQVQPSGTLRISAPTTYGHHRLLPLLPLFRAKYPLIKLEVHMQSQRRLPRREFRPGYTLSLSTGLDGDRTVSRGRCSGRRCKSCLPRARRYATDTR